MADEKDNTSKKTETKTKAKAFSKPEGKVAATYSQEEAKTIKVRAKDGTQMYDPVTRTTYTDDEKGVEAREGDQFVVTNLDRSKLVKV